MLNNQFLYNSRAYNRGRDLFVFVHDEIAIFITNKWQIGKKFVENIWYRDHSIIPFVY